MLKDPFDKPPPRKEDDDDREKKSWSEIDSERNRSFHTRDKTKPQKATKASKRAETLAKKALDELFQGRKSKEQEHAWRHVCEAQGKSFSVRSNHYLEKYGFPRDWDDLLRLLDHTEIPIVEAVLDKMMELVASETAARKDLLVGKLRIMKMTWEDPKILSKMDLALQTLNQQG